MHDERFLSLGVDIGTTTTHLIFSELELTQVGEPGQIPRPGIGERKILHRGRVRFTPLAGPDLIDAAGVEAVIREEFAASGLSSDRVRTGAVLITGETARKDNAEEVVRRIADLAGDFVAAAAGPNLESLLSGRGSGAADISRRRRRRVLNIDIGGGTSNFAWFDRGRCTATACLRVGGRHVRFEPDGKVSSFTAIGSAAAAEAGVRLVVGDKPCREAREAIALALAGALLDAVDGHWSTSPLREAVAVTQPQSVQQAPDIVVFSGGVGEVMRDAADGRADPEADPLRFGDLGPELAAAILGLRSRSAAEWEYPDEPIRATVIGAGMYAAQISGETIWVDPALLPLSNLPVLKPFARVRDLLPASNAVAHARAAAAMMDHDWSAHPAAMLLPELVELDLRQIELVAESLRTVVEQIRPKPPIVLLMSDDLARTLGRLLEPHWGGSFLAIDELDTTEVEYVDIGRAMGDVVPVVLKSLVFG